MSKHEGSKHFTLSTRDGWPANGEGNSDAVFDIRRDCPGIQVEFTGIEFPALKDEEMVRKFLNFCGKWMLGLEGGFVIKMGGENVVVQILPVKDSAFSDYLITLRTERGGLVGMLFFEAEYASTKGIDAYTYNLQGFDRWENKPYFKLHEVGRVTVRPKSKGSSALMLEADLSTKERRALSASMCLEAVKQLVTKDE